jgi:hypothetical protein
MTPDEFASLVEAALAKADNECLPAEVQVEILEHFVQAMRDALMR